MPTDSSSSTGAVGNCAKYRDDGYNSCAEYRDQGRNECAEYRDEGYNQCSGWEEQCCDWQPCKWLCKQTVWVCKGWYWVSSWVCAAWYWVANVVCMSWVWVTHLVCVAWFAVVSLMLTFFGFIAQLFSPRADEPKARIMLETPSSLPLSEVAAFVRRTLGSGWTVEKVFLDFNPRRDIPQLDNFYVAQSAAAIGENVFDVCHRLLGEEFLMSAYPDLPYKGFFASVPRPPRPPSPPPPNDLAWHLRQMNVPQAWQIAKGSGVLIGHPDTGFTRHVDMDAATALDLEQAFDVIRKEPGGEDPLIKEGPLDFPGHGTFTASVIISRGGLDASPDPAAEKPGGTTPPGKITGVAPEARLLPLRAVRSVVLGVENGWVAQAVHRAVSAGSHVISMSLGGFPCPALHYAVANATHNDVIVLAAAGNYFPPVVWPAQFSECIAIGGSNINFNHWPYSSRGPRVCVSAPAENVWFAASDGNGAGSQVSAGSGTSFAVACAAGVAALWLSAHGRDTILKRYRPTEALPALNRLQSVFREILKSTAFKPQVWHPGLGEGIIDAFRAVKSPLPDLPPDPTIPGWSIYEVCLGLFDAIESELAKIQLSAMFARPLVAGHDTYADERLDGLIEKHGAELIYLFMTLEGAFESFLAAAGALIEGDAARSRELLLSVLALLRAHASNALRGVLASV